MKLRRQRRVVWSGFSRAAANRAIIPFVVFSSGGSEDRE